jgi:hypothetical protein
MMLLMWKLDTVWPCGKPALVPFLCNQPVPRQLQTFLWAFWSKFSVNSGSMQWEVLAVTSSFVKIPRSACPFSVTCILADWFALTCDRVHCYCSCFKSPISIIRSSLCTTKFVYLYILCSLHSVYMCKFLSCRAMNYWTHYQHGYCCS